MKDILVSAPMEFVALNKDFNNEQRLLINPMTNVSDADLIESKETILTWVVSPCPTYKVDLDVISNFPNLKSVVTPSTGTNHIAVKDLESAGVVVLSLRDSELYNSILASSEYTFSLILSLVRKIPEASIFPMLGKWRESESKLRSRELNTLTLGIIGLGRIGANVAKFASSMDMSIQYFDPHVENKVYRKRSTLEDIFASSDVVLLSLVLDSSTANLISRHILMQSKRGLLLVNTSRGEVIEEDSVYEFIKNKKLGGYAADVLVGEVDGTWRNSPILKLVKDKENVIVTPHIAGLTYDSESKAQNIALSLALNSI